MKLAKIANVASFLYRSISPGSVNRRQGLSIVGVLFLACSLSVVSPVAGLAYDTEETTVEVLMRLNPGMTEEDVLAQAADLAAVSGISPEVILEEQRAEAETSAAAMAGNASVQTPYSGSDGGKWLHSSLHPADIFITPASTLFVEHGHTGIYVGPYEIIEAPGAGQLSWQVMSYDITVPVGTVIQTVDATEQEKFQAMYYAQFFMVGKPYNMNFANNKHVPADSYNCSQLVWGAYMATSGIDLDSNGGWGVYPYDIRDSPLTSTYMVLTDQGWW